MFLLMDSNCLINDFWLKLLEYKDIKENSYELGIKLFSSSVVYDEVLHQYEEKLYEYIRQVNKCNNLPDRFKLKIKNDQVPQIVKEYDHFLDTELKSFNQYGTRVIEFEHINFKNVYDKAINKFKPFSSSGKGFKDAMIWEHVKWIVNTYCNEHRKLAFITNNLEDFCDKTAQSSGDAWYYPADHLIKEYSDLGYDRDTVRIYKDLKTFCFDIVRGKVNEYNKYLDELNTINNTDLKSFIYNQINSEDANTDNMQYDRKNLKMIINAKAISAHNSYGEAGNNEVIIYCKAEILYEFDFNENKFMVVVEDFYIHSNIKEKTLIYIEELT